MPQPNCSRYTVEVWFDRALRFRPDDSGVRMIGSTDLNKNGRVTEAATCAKDNAFTHCNMDLRHVNLENHDKALIPANKAIAPGFTHAALRDKSQSA